MGDVRRIVVVVEDKEAARTALQWALHNLLRQGDVIVLLHVFSPPPRKKKSTAARNLRRHGYHLALSFREICNAFFNTNTEIIVREGDDDGRMIAQVVKEIGASTLLVGLHQNSFLYRWAMSGIDVARNFDCKVMAIKQPSSPEQLPSAKVKGHKTSPTIATSDSLTNFDFSQIDISGLRVPEILTPPKVPYRLCPSPHANQDPGGVPKTNTVSSHSTRFFVSRQNEKAKPLLSISVPNLYSQFLCQRRQMYHQTLN